jgi:Mo-dependent nitrogenase C-terminus
LIKRRKSIIVLTFAFLLLVLFVAAIAIIIHKEEEVKKLIDRLEFHDPTSAHLLCKVIPAACPFNKKVKLVGRVVFEIPPLCKLNPFYEEVVSLRLRALGFLSAHGVDIEVYCR